MTMRTRCSIELPAWAVDMLAGRRGAVHADEDGMRLAIELAAENVRQGTGGPFGAIVADTRLGEVVGVGVNLVTSSLVSMAHAEIVALSLSQATEGDWDLSHKRPLTLFATCEPCAMCFGALPWSGIETLVVGARTADAEAAGFDEGAKPDRWIEALAARGIAVRTDVLRDEAVKLFELYRELGGEIYGPREVRA